MPEVVVTGGETEAPSTVEASAHEAAVAEGATAVIAANAEQSAAEAAAAAEVALAAADANIASADTVVQAAEQATQSAAQAGVNAEMVHEALLAQTRAIAELTAELQASRKAQAAPQDKPARAAPDRKPDSGGKRWVRR
jgi:hypothetical protein